MHRPLPHPVSTLVLVLTLGTGSLIAAPAPRLEKALLSQYQVQQPMRVALAQTHLTSLRAQLGLNEHDAFVPRHTFTNLQGQAIVRLEQTYKGHRVWGSQAIAHVLPDGGIRTLTKSVRSGISLPGEPRLNAEQARKIALRHLAPMGSMKDVPTVERVVFPAHFLGGLATRLDTGTGLQVLDPKLTVYAKLDAPYVWAYEVRTRLQNREDGHKELCYLIDGNTGAILRINDMLQHLEAAQGPGKGMYRGDVTLNTTRMLDGSYALMDTTRGTQPNPGLMTFAAEPISGWDPAIPALQIWYSVNDTQGVPLYFTGLFESSVNAWGDGLRFTDWGNEGGINGQTAGVDAMSAATTTWDFYKNVFGRDGLDGQGTAVAAFVLVNKYDTTYGDTPDNAAWSIWDKSMYLGAGSFPDNPNGGGNPNGLSSLTDLDVIAHEMTHGVTSPSGSQLYCTSSGFEESGLNEAVSDFFAQMVKTYASRTGNDSVIPPTITDDWQIGMGVGHGTPLRWLDKPSLDQRSADGWYDGVRYMDGHLSAGPLNRAFYFLCNGASGSAGDVAFSPFLPAGMTGVGNDDGARIIYKAVTEDLIGDGTWSFTFMDVREACLAAAEDLFGADSAQVIAVGNAFSAVNVGYARGQAPRVQVIFEEFRAGDYIMANWDPGTRKYANRQIFPKGETVFPNITVLNTSNTAVTWSLGGLSMSNGASGGIDTAVFKGGTINPDGSWTTPYWLGFHALTATSKADPNQFAEGRALVIGMDTDQDGEKDALDMAGISFSWMMAGSLSPLHSVFESPLVYDSDIAFFVDGMKNAWPVK